MAPRLLAPALVLAALLCAAPPAGAVPASKQRAVIFVHGFFGSGAQFESQKMRLTSNGYHERYVRDLEYDSTFGTESRQMVFTRLDALVAELK